MLAAPALVTAFLRWSFARSALWRGYWTVMAVYIVVVADLSASELVLVGSAQSLTVLIAEVPAGVLADTMSRRNTLVLAHLVMGGGMVMAGLVTSFPLLALSQCLCGLGWACSSGADVAWITDELARPIFIDRVLASSARWHLLGELFGAVLFGVLAWATSLASAVVVSGFAMVASSAVVARWPETRFVRVDTGRRWHEATARFRRGFRLARVDHVILGLVVATALINGGAQLFGRVTELRLLHLGFPTRPDPIVWFTALACTRFLVGAAVLRIVEVRIHGTGVATRAYVLACAGGAAGLVVFAHAPDAATAVLGVLLFAGLAEPVTRAAATISVNRRAPTVVRATMHSILSQAENAGEFVFGLALAGVVAATTTTTALMCAAVLAVAAGAVVLRSADEV